MKNKNNSSNKGFLREIAGVKKTKPEIKNNQIFKWENSVVKPDRIRGMSTEKKLDHLTPSKTGNSDFVKEAKKFIKERGEK